MADMYEQLYQAKLNEIKKKKDQGLADLASEEQGVNNTYTDLYNTLNTKQQDAATEYYGQRNQAAVSNAQNVQQIRDWMAKNNLLQSGESADQLMRSNTDFSNEVGRIKSNESNFNRDILNQRSNANREQAQKIADILNRRKLTNDAYTGDETALRSEIEVQRLQDQQAAQTAARASSSSRGTSSKSSSSQRTSSQGNNAATLAWEEFQNQFNAGTAPLWLEQYADSLKNTVGTTEYNKMVKTYEDLFNQKYTTQQDYRKSDKQRLLMEGQ